MLLIGELGIYVLLRFFPASDPVACCVVVGQDLEEFGADEFLDELEELGDIVGDVEAGEVFLIEEGVRGLLRAAFVELVFLDGQGVLGP